MRNRARAAAALGPSGAGVLVVGRSSNLSFLSGVPRVEIHGARPFFPQALFFPEDLSVHLQALVPPEWPLAPSTFLLPQTWDPARLANLFATVRDVGAAPVVAVDGLTPGYRQMLAASFPRCRVVFADEVLARVRSVPDPVHLDRMRRVLEHMRRRAHPVLSGVAGGAGSQPGPRAAHLAGDLVSAMLADGGTCPTPVVRLGEPDEQGPRWGRAVAGSPVAPVLAVDVTASVEGHLVGFATTVALDGHGRLAKARSAWQALRDEVVERLRSGANLREAVATGADGPHAASLSWAGSGMDPLPDGEAGTPDGAVLSFQATATARGATYFGRAMIVMNGPATGLL